MRKAILLALAICLASPAFAVDRWHRASDGGQDLMDDDGTVVGMVRHAKTGDDSDWVGYVGAKRGSESWVVTGHYGLMREAKKAVQSKAKVESE